MTRLVPLKQSAGADVAAVVLERGESSSNEAVDVRCLRRLLHLPGSPGRRVHTSINHSLLAREHPFQERRGRQPRIRIALVHPGMRCR